MRQITTTMGNTLTCIGETKLRGGNYVLVTCNVCSKDTELYKEPFLVLRYRFPKGIGTPCGCSGRFHYNEEQAKILARRRCAAAGKNFYGFSGEFKGISKTPVKGNCTVHNNVTWHNIFNYLKTDKECTVCSRRDLVFGVGINDAIGTIYKCPYFSTWYGMLKRCYSPKDWVRNPTYKDCTVSEDWKYFSNFKNWMIAQDWEDKHLDKDLLVSGNRVYSEGACMFLKQKINSFIRVNIDSSRDYPIGVNKAKRGGNYEATCCGVYLGSFPTVKEAHLSWQRGKIIRAQSLLDGECSRVTKKLQSIVDNIKKDIALNQITTTF